MFDAPTIYYINLLILQYYTKVKARNTVGVFVQEAVAQGLIVLVRDAFNLDAAVGSQLDKLAAYRGAQRVVYGLDLTRVYLAYPGYDDSPSGVAGFATYDDDPASVTSFWLLYADTSRPMYAMTDDELRRLVKLLALTHAALLSVKDIDDILWTIFGTKVKLQDNEDMTLLYIHASGDTDNLFKIAKGVEALPKPMGVLDLTA